MVNVNKQKTLTGTMSTHLLNLIRIYVMHNDVYKTCITFFKAKIKYASNILISNNFIFATINFSNGAQLVIS